MWKTAFGNSCFRGCLVYLAALVLVVVVGAAGLGGLGARFGGGTQTTSLTVATRPVEPTPKPAQGSSAQPETTPPTQVEPTAQTAPPPVSVDSAPQVQAQGGVITGQASAPFYVVQGGDTLWGIAQNYGVSIESLRSLNKLKDDVLKPGQLLYLPEGASPSTPETGVDNQP